VRLRCAAASDVLNSRFVEAKPTIRAAAHVGAVVVVLAVVLPSALPADVMRTAAVEGPVSATWARIRPAFNGSEDIARLRVRLEPRPSLSDEFVVSEVGIVAGSTYDSLAHGLLSSPDAGLRSVPIGSYGALLLFPWVMFGRGGGVGVSRGRALRAR